MNPSRLPSTRITSASFNNCVPTPEPLGPAEPAFNGCAYGIKSPCPGDVVQGAFNISARANKLLVAFAQWFFMPQPARITGFDALHKSSNALFKDVSLAVGYLLSLNF